jgi:division protein CdvB (Snf7/Vps24/ESCRT-III family)
MEEKISELENRLAYATSRLDKRGDTASKRISHLQKDTAICKASGLANKQQIDALQKQLDFIYSLDTIQYHSQYKRSS